MCFGDDKMPMRNFLDPTMEIENYRFPYSAIDIERWHDSRTNVWLLNFYFHFFPVNKRKFLLGIESKNFDHNSIMELKMKYEERKI